MGEENLAAARKCLQIQTHTYIYACIYSVSTALTERKAQEGQL